MTEASDLPELILRLARLAEAEAWAQGLNPAQAAALAYLGRANRFSRAPSQVADWLGATRGTVSQTLKALAARGLVEEDASPRDRRSISYGLTEAGRAALSHPAPLDHAAAALPEAAALAAAQALARVLGDLLARQGNRPFGLCRTCRHHQPRGGAGAWCGLLSQPLAPEEAMQICHEHAA
ncbi:MAG: MarR family transcriptional regulator [Rhodobacter sp.]|nr:MarR family transcriptional regulator [Rhodobacter sp.]